MFCFWGRGRGGDNCVRWYETWIQSSGCVSTKTFVWNAIQKEMKRRTIPPTIYKESQVVFFLRGRHTKLVAFTFQSWLLLWCVDLSVQGPKNESLFSCSCNTVDPHSSRKQSTFSLSFFKPSSFFFSPKYLSHPFCPSCPLARSEVETCVSLHHNMPSPS